MTADVTHERAVLSSMLCFPGCITDVIGFISAYDFFKEDHRQIFTAIVDHHRDGLPVEIPALVATLKNERYAIALLELIEIGTTGETAGWYAEKVLRASRNRQLTVMGVELQNHPERFEEIMTRMQKIRDSTAVIRETLFGNALTFLNENIKVNYLIHKIIESSALAAIVGPSGQYKSFVSICIACSVVTGKEWNEHRVKRGAVLYLCGEGRAGIIRRVKAWMYHHGLQPADLAGLYLSKSTLMMDGSNIGQIVAEMQGIDVQLIIVDTLARHINGHENDTLDMGTFVNHVDALKHRLGAAAIVVHHTGHQDQGRARGNTAFRAALDTEIICDKGTLSFSKSKDSEPPEKIEFKLHQVVIGSDEETGEDITSAVCVYGEKSEKQKLNVLTPFEQLALDALVTICVNENVKHGGQYYGDQDKWRQEYYRIRRIEDNSLTSDTLKKSFQLVTGTTNRGGGLKGKCFVGFVENIGAIPLRLEDQNRIFNIINNDGKREQGGNKAGTVPGQGGREPGTHLLIGVPVFPSDNPGTTDCDDIEAIEIEEAA